MKTLTKSPTINIAFSEYLAIGQPLFIGRGVFMDNILLILAVVIMELALVMMALGMSQQGGSFWKFFILGNCLCICLVALIFAFAYISSKISKP